MKLTDKISYLSGLVDGMELDLSTKEGKVLAQVLEVLRATALYLEDLQDQVDELTDVCESLDSDLADVEEAVFETQTQEAPEDSEYEEDEADDWDEDDGLYETICPTCEQTIVMDESVLDHGSMECPNCGELLEFDFDDSEDTESAEELEGLELDDLTD